MLPSYMRRYLAAILLTGLSTAAAAQAVTADQRAILQHSMYQACYGNASANDTFKAASAKLKTDVAQNYCSCVANNVSQKVSLSDLQDVAKTHALPASINAMMTAESQTCAQQAARPAH